MVNLIKGLALWYGRAMGMNTGVVLAMLSDQSRSYVDGGIRSADDSERQYVGSGINADCIEKRKL